MSISGSATEPNKKRNKLKHSKGNNKKIRFASNGSEVEVFSRRTLSRLPTSHSTCVFPHSTSNTIRVPHPLHGLLVQWVG